MSQERPPDVGSDPRQQPGAGEPPPPGYAATPATPGTQARDATPAPTVVAQGPTDASSAPVGTAPAEVTQGDRSSYWVAPAGAVETVERPARVLVAGIFLILVGLLVTLSSLLFFLGGALIGGAGSTATGLPAGLDLGALQGIITIVGVVVLLWGLAHLLGGIGSIARRGWGRVLGLIAAILGLVLTLLGLVGSLGAAQGTADVGGAGDQTTGLIVTIFFIVAYAFSVWALATSGRWFSSRA